MSSLSSFLLGPTNPQQVTSSSSTSQTLPSWLTQYSSGLLSAANGLVPQTVSNLGNTASPLSTAQPYLGQASSLVSGATSPTNSGLSLAQPGIGQASSLATSAVNPANSGTTAASPYMGEANQTFSNPSTVSSYMSPYLSDVTGYNTALANQNLQQNILPAVESQSIANGDFAGSPMGTAMGQQIDLTQQNLQAQNLAAANTGYQEAGSLFDTDAARQAALASTAGTLATQQQGAQLQGASTLGSLAGELGTLGTGEQQIGLTGANALGSLGTAAGQLGGTGNSEQLSQLGLLESMTGTPGGSTTTVNASNPNPYSEMQTAGSASSSLANLAALLTGSSKGGILGAASSLFGSGNGAGATNAGAGTTDGTAPTAFSNQFSNPYTDTSAAYSPNYTGTTPNDPTTINWATANQGLPGFGYTDYTDNARGGLIRYASGGMSRPPPLFTAADGGAVEVPSVAQDLSLLSAPNAIFMPADASTSPAAQQQSAASSAMPSLPAASTAAPTSTLAGALGALLGPSSSGGAASASPSAAQSAGAALGDANTAAKLYNTGSNLTGGTGLSGTTAGSALGTANDIYGLYNAVSHPGVATGIGGAAGLGDLYTKATGTSLGAFGTALGGAGDIAGIYNAIKNPSIGNTLSGGYDAYKLYGLGSKLVSSLGSAPTAADLGIDTTSDLGVGDLGLSTAGSAGDAAISSDIASSLASGAADAGAGAAPASALTSASAGAGAGTGALGALSTLGSVAVPLAAAGVAGDVIAGIIQGNQRGPALTFNSAPGVTQNPEGKLPSGNAIAAMDGIGYGEGNNEAQGSGQLYRVNPNGSAANNTAYDWLGQAATNQADQAYTDYQQSLQPASSGATAFIGGAAANNPTTDLANANAAYSDLFNSTGGAKAWGMSETDFQKNMISLAGDANSNGGNGLLVGVG